MKLVSLMVIILAMIFLYQKSHANTQCDAKIQEQYCAILSETNPASKDEECGGFEYRGAAYLMKYTKNKETTLYGTSVSFDKSGYLYELEFNSMAGTGFAAVVVDSKCKILAKQNISVE